MKISQIDESPIGNYFHDSGVMTIFNALVETVDNFEVDSDQLYAWCEGVVKSIKGLQAKIKECERKEIKKIHERQIHDMTHRGIE